eukprot:CAMPEP_0196601882 /NCGR_PEP_ID=MMETSP1081-20130531/96141_1 /TAXON_ID=36882 /ORGANISM="Pyramimonas amylifera, Strain CCMP720" /LENGTH=74 /DNA_ID=CAMNT_0041927779 /DNA_START=492 /DNA_END=716 /DNA_ORIENTATION=+
MQELEEQGGRSERSEEVRGHSELTGEDKSSDGCAPSLSVLSSAFEVLVFALPWEGGEAGVAPVAPRSTWSSSTR